MHPMHQRTSTRPLPPVRSSFRFIPEVRGAIILIIQKFDDPFQVWMYSCTSADLSSNPQPLRLSDFSDTIIPHFATRELSCRLLSFLVRHLFWYVTLRFQRLATRNTSFGPFASGGPWSGRTRLPDPRS